MSVSEVTPQQIARYREEQETIASRVLAQPLSHPPRVIAAVDLHFSGDLGIAAAIAVDYPGLRPVGEYLTSQPVTFPYIPGFLAFREAPVCLAAIQGLPVVPDLVLLDGQGRAHPRRAGIACHVGVELGIPTIGVAKSILVGQHEPLGTERGSVAPLITDGEVVGMAVRTRTGVRPVYVSVGHLITLDEAVEWTLRATTRYRLPEPSRLAHRHAQAAARAHRERSGEGEGHGDAGDH